MVVKTGFHAAHPASFGILNEAVNQVLTHWLLNIRLAGEPENRVTQAVAASEVKQSAKKLDLKIQQDVRSVQGGSVVGAQIDRYQATDIVIESAVTVVSFARKSGAQQIVSIEDFYGGLFLGFLIGFLGQNYALNLINPAPTG